MKKKTKGLYMSLGWKRHSKRSLYAHHFRNGKCIDCGLSESVYKKRMGIK